MGGYIRGIVFLILVILLITFSAKNSQPVQLTYYFGVAVEIPLFWLVYISILIGIIVGIGFGIYKRLALGRRISELRIEIGELKGKILGGKQGEKEESFIKEALFRKKA